MTWSRTHLFTSILRALLKPDSKKLWLRSTSLSNKTSRNLSTIAGFDAEINKSRWKETSLDG